jgi:nucleoside-diphosphate-sugar epimerase
MSIYTEDLSEIVADINVPWHELKNSTVLVTGATGLVGSAIVKSLSAANAKYGLSVKILAFGRNETKGEFLEKCGAIFCKNDIREPISIDEKVNYIFHCAAVTTSKEMVANPVGVIETALKGTENILTLAKEKQVKSMVNVSSMEVYGITDPALPYIKEENLGYIDLEKPRSCYPESKRICELLCNCWHSQYGMPIKSARLAQTFGAGTPKEDTRVFAQFARNAIAGENIVLHTEGKSSGNYCYITDVVRGLFLLLLKGESGQAYNIANPVTSMTIREVAELVAREVGSNKISVIVNIPDDLQSHGYAPTVKMRLNSDKLMALGWQPKYGLADMFKRMIADWQEQ